MTKPIGERKAASVTPRRVSLLCKKTLAFGGAVMVAACAMAQLNLIPAPREVKETGGFFVSASGGDSVPVRSEIDASVPKEGYRLSVTADGISVKAADEAGLFYARQTLKQLGENSGKEWRYPCVEIGDWPAFRWRGVMLDEARHFLGKEVVMRLIDRMSEYKYNVFHWHLTDDQGWRIEIKRHPELVEYGAVRPKSVKFGTRVTYVNRKPTYQYNAERYGPFFYTQDDVREMIAYAKARHVKIVPEIEAPGHVRALLAAHPEFGCRGEALERVPRCAWAVEEDVLCAGNDEAVAFVEDVLDEVQELFGADVIHIGGDECPKVRWRECPKCLARIEKEGLRDVKSLQTWISTRFTRHLEKRGCRVVGWDEILAGDIPQSAIGMCWRMSSKGGAGDDLVTPKVAAQRGHEVIVASTAYCYVSRSQGLPEDPYPYHTYHLPLSLEKAYGYDPLDGLDEAEAKQVIGGEACMWGESLWNVFDLEWKMWPRGMALAEIFWANPKSRDFADFKRRASVHRSRLISERVNCAPVESASR